MRQIDFVLPCYFCPSLKYPSCCCPSMTPPMRSSNIYRYPSYYFCFFSSYLFCCCKPMSYLFCCCPRMRWRRPRTHLPLCWYVDDARRLASRASSQLEVHRRWDATLGLSRCGSRTPTTHQMRWILRSPFSCVCCSRPHNWGFKSFGGYERALY